MSDYAYEGTRRVVYGEGATFVPVCVHCGRFVRAPKTARFSWSDAKIRVKCSKCGPSEMLFEGWI